MASSSASSSLQGLCPGPFLQEDKFPTSGEFIGGRLCEPIAILGNISCCLPCPTTEWVYSDEFMKRTEVANWMNVGAFVCIVFLLSSFAILDVKWTHRHYLSICMAVSVAFMEVAFIIPLAAKPDQCKDEITPNDMDSNLTCAFTGSFLLFGAWATVLWVFYRALSLHLQICWALVPGKKFFYTAMIMGWALPAVGLTLALVLTGVSFRFGNVCHINHHNSLQDFWGPLLAFAAAGMIVQFVTLAYCIQVYVKSLFDDSPGTTETSSQLPSYQGSVRTATARQTYRRVKKIILLQWRGIAVVLCIVLDVVFFAIVFVSMDNSFDITKTNAETAQQWVLCLVSSGGNKNKCLSLVSPLVTNENTIMAVLILLSVAGLWVILFLGRWSMVLGWVDLYQRRFLRRNNEFVSVDATVYHDPRDYEMLSSTPKPVLKSPEPVASPDIPLTGAVSPRSPAERIDYFGRDAKYKSPPMSFSVPRPPSATLSPNQQNREWDPASTHAPSRTVHGPAGYSQPYS